MQDRCRRASHTFRAAQVVRNARAAQFDRIIRYALSYTEPLAGEGKSLVSTRVAATPINEPDKWNSMSAKSGRKPHTIPMHAVYTSRKTKSPPRGLSFMRIILVRGVRARVRRLSSFVGGRNARQRRKTARLNNPMVRNEIRMSRVSFTMLPMSGPKLSPRKGIR